MKTYQTLRYTIAWISLLVFTVVGFIWLDGIAQRYNGKALPLFAGWGSAVVASDSMEPSLPVGATIWIQEQDKYYIGDIVSYEASSGLLITHRILQLQEGVAITKGDANQEQDPAFPIEKIIGKVQFIMPPLSQFLGGSETAASIGYAIIFFLLAWDLLFSVRTSVESIRVIRTYLQNRKKNH